MNALIIATNKQISSALSKELRRADADNILLAFDSVSAKRLVSERNIDLTLVYADSTLPGATELARVIAAKGSGGVILVQASGGDALSRRLEEEGIIVLEKPISHIELHRAIMMVKATNNKIARLVEEKRDLLKKIDDMRIINRAKLILMQNLGYDEDRAHRHIEKAAMDQRRTRAEIAMEILKTYEV